jgi:ATP-dependent helicase/nuclease subunit B
MQRQPLGPRIYWLLPPQATFTAQRQLACDSGLAGFCRARVLSLRQLGQDVFDECGGGATPLVTDIGRQMILGRLLRELAPQLEFFGSAARQPGLAAELDRTFDELERAGKTADDLAKLIADLDRDRSHDSDSRPLAAKLRDLHLLYQRYTAFLGQERLDPHRRLLQVVDSIEHCSFFKTASVYLDGFLDFTEFERRMIAAIAKSGATIEITLLMDPQSPILANPNLNPETLVRADTGTGDDQSAGAALGIRTSGARR